MEQKQCHHQVKQHVPHKSHRVQRKGCGVDCHETNNKRKRHYRCQRWRLSFAIGADCQWRCLSVAPKRCDRHRLPTATLKRHDRHRSPTAEVEWSPVWRNAKGRRCDLEWVSVWVGVVGNLEWDFEWWRFICNSWAQQQRLKHRRWV